MPSSTYTLLDVVNVVGFRVGNFKQTIDTLDNPDLPMKNMIECVNEVLRDLARVKPMPMTNARTTIATEAQYVVGTVTVVPGSTTVVGVGTVWTSSMIGRAFSLMSKAGVYRISAFTDATHIELDRAWVGDATLATESYIIVQDRYSLPSDFFDFISVSLEGDTTRTIEVRRPSEVDSQRYSLRMKPVSPGPPTMATIFDQSTTGNWEIELDPQPDKAYRIVMRYRKNTTRVQRDGDIIPLTDENIDFLYSGCFALWKSFMVTEQAVAYENWKRQVLPYYAAFDSRQTDEVPRIVPANVMRETAPRSSILGMG